jgi:hypothetical protein
MAQFDPMYLHFLGALKGWPSQTAVDFAAPIATSVTIDAGMGVALNSAGALKLGIVRAEMGLFAMQGNDEFDVAVGLTPNIAGYAPINPSGKVNCLVANYGYELETTEFDTAQAYTPNQPLRAGTNGKLTNQTVVPAAHTDTPQTSSTAVCGVVSRGKYTNAYGATVLAFWTVWYPGRSTE